MSGRSGALAGSHVRNAYSRLASTRPWTTLDTRTWPASAARQSRWASTTGALRYCSSSAMGAPAWRATRGGDWPLPAGPDAARWMAWAQATASTALPKTTMTPSPRIFRARDAGAARRTNCRCRRRASSAASRVSDGDPGWLNRYVTVPSTGSGVAVTSTVRLDPAGEVVEQAPDHPYVALHHELVDVGAVGRLAPDWRGRKHDDRARRLEHFEPAGHGEAAAAGQHEVHDHHVDGLAAGHLDGRRQVGR